MNKYEKGLVSIIVPTRNSSETLEDCLLSIRAQTYSSIEVIVVDNFSSDKTREIASKFGAKVLLCEGERSHQVNYGAGESRGEYVYRVDSDFVLENTVVAECVQECIENNADGALVHNTSDPALSLWAKVRNIEREMYRDDDLNVAVRFLNKKAFNILGGFDEHLIAGEDYDLHNRFLNHGFKYVRVKSIEIHRGEPKQLSSIVRKHFYYGKSLSRFFNKNRYRAFRQLSPFRSAFVKHREVFATKPHLTIVFMFYTLVRYSSAFSGVIACRLGIQENDLRKIAYTHRPNVLPPLKCGVSPIISVVIPTRNSERSLKNCIRSVRESSYSGITEILVVDNHSRDKTLSLARSLGATVTIAGPERSEQRNMGAKMAIGEYLLFLDADMELSPSVIPECLVAIEKGVDAAILSEETVGEGYWVNVRKLERKSYFGDSLYEAARLFRREIFLRLGGYDKSLTGLEDYDIEARLERSGVDLVHLDALIFHHEENFSVRKHLMKKFYYASNSYMYITKYPKRSIVQFFPLRRSFFRRRSPVAQQPLAFLGLIFLKFNEVFVAAIGVISGILQEKSSKPNKLV